MEGLSGASSVLAIVDLSAKVALLCFQYFNDVKKARDDISRLRREVANLEHASKSIQQLINGPHCAKLEASQQLSIAIQDCQSRLHQLHDKLRPKTARQAITRLGSQTLKWPFQSKDVEHIVQGLERCTRTMHLALQVDQTTNLLEIDRKTVLDRLPIAKGASFDSHEEEHDRICLQNTRVDLLQQISAWAADPKGSTIFWLNGMAGTGKSTIARTVAQNFTKGHRIGASFFFKRGEADRGGLNKFFSTIAADLIARKPAMSLHMKNAIDADPAILRKAMREQFDRLILEPLSMIAPEIRNDPTVVVVDALDECERQDDIRLLVYLFSRTNMLEAAGLRIFLTSRPELPIRLGFSRIKGTYQDLVLHQIPETMVEHDISAFLEYELANVRDEYNDSVREDRKLPESWPGQSTIELLVRMASPLFIFAATVCRFIADRNDANPDRQLQEVLHMGSDISQLDATYLPVLNRLIMGLSNMRRDKVLQEFRRIVGAIIVLADPLSTSALAQILDIPRENIDDRLDMLHSVLSIPPSAESPVRLLHLSFRDFLLDPDKRGKNPFWIDKIKAHKEMTIGCLRVMCHLRQDICGVQAPGTPRSTISAQKVNACLSPEVQYACLYWVYHLQEAGNHCLYSEQVYDFLTHHFLHWIEALSLLGRASESVRLITALQAFAKLQEHTELLDLVDDAFRFILAGISVIDAAPLQIYPSLLAFAPNKSPVRLTFENQIPSWILLGPKTESVWAQYRQTLEDHGAAVNSLAFSHDSMLIASASNDKTVRIWRADTSQCVQALKCHNNWVNSVAFSHDSTLVASASGDMVCICRVDTGECIQTLKGHRNVVNSATFSHDSTLVASGSSDKMIRIWRISTGDCIQTLQGHTNWVRSVVFSHDSTLIASASDDKMVRIWRVPTGQCVQVLRGHSSWVRSVAFSHDSTLVASASDDQMVRVWSVNTGECIQTLKGHGGWVNSIAFSHDSALIASASDDKIIRIWSTATGECIQALKGHRSWVNSVAFSHDSKLVASASDDTMIRIWCVNTDTHIRILEDPNDHSGAVSFIAFSHDSTLVASASNDKMLIWRVNAGECMQTLKYPRGNGGAVKIIAFSQDSALAAASVDDIIVIWHVNTGEYTQTLESPKGPSGAVNTIAFSHDSTLVASGSNNGIVQIWCVDSGKCKKTLTGHSSWVTSAAFSCDSIFMASASNDKMIRIWSVETGECTEEISVGITTDVLSFAADNTRLLTTHGIFTIRDTPSVSCCIDARNISSPEPSAVYSISKDRSWITFNGENTLWLPVEFRPCCWAVSGSTIVIGCESGKVITIRLSCGVNRVSKE